jgi:hypothetical protein
MFGAPFELCLRELPIGIYLLLESLEESLTTRGG